MKSYRSTFRKRVRITAEMRDVAATLCSVMASNEIGNNGWFVPPCASLGVECVKYDGPAELARLAMWASGESDSARSWADAEAALRTGWLP